MNSEYQTPPHTQTLMYGVGVGWVTLLFSLAHFCVQHFEFRYFFYFCHTFLFYFCLFYFIFFLVGGGGGGGVVRKMNNCGVLRNCLFWVCFDCGGGGWGEAGGSSQNLTVCFLRPDSRCCVQAYVARKIESSPSSINLHFREAVILYYELFIHYVKHILN